ncbi:MAG: TonB-dependent receptor, partial [Candidatus Eremiobacteraeota bacterium]|nr:TonB-dependent receptor [Candidatus Eremiobacteraeota bacterium]
MSRRRRLGRGLLVIVAALACVFLTPVARAGTTGSISGTVYDAATKAPIAGAAVTAESPSQVAHVTTDASGRFAFLSLAPETYTISASREGYIFVSIAGISVFADQNQSLSLALQKSLKQIAHVTSQSALSPVKAGVGTDVYSVNPGLTTAAATLGGGGGLNNAYSAIAAMPGAYVPPNQVGVNQTVYIRGGYFDQIGYEYDGVPINRSFDNYPGNSETTLGQQELQIYTGGGEADANATGLAGFINQVIKTGTYPGYAVAGLALGTPTFYHDARVEAGGSTPDRLFSYYVGISGTNQDFRYFDQFNGASLTDSIPYGYWPAHVTTFLPAFYPAVYPTCTNNFTYTNPLKNTLYTDPGCFGSYPSNYGQPSSFDSRDVVANVHVGLPHRHDAGRDDVQLLYMSSANFTQYYSSLDDSGPLGLAIENDGLAGSPPDFYGGNVNQWPDSYTFPAGTQWLAPASTHPIAYYYPGSPTARCANVTGVPNACPFNANGSQIYSLVPSDVRDARWDTANIAKLQYQKNIGSTAYVRLFGYTFYSNTNRASPNGYGNNVTLGVENYQYEVDSHTGGLELQFADQLSGEHLLEGMVSYITSNTLRYFNHAYYNTGSQQVSNFTNGSECFSAAPGYSYNLGDPAPCNSTISQGTFSLPYGPPIGSGYQSYFNTQNPCAAGELPKTSPACKAGASMLLTYLGNQGFINSVVPKLTNASLSDQWRPSDAWNINAAVRFENDAYGLADTNNPATNFWFAAARREFCVNPVTRQPIFIPQPPQSIFVFTPFVGFDCPIDRSTGKPVQTVHPNGTDGILLTNNYPSTYSVGYGLPRISATYTVSPDTVLRFSAGRYAQQPQNYEIQYVTIEPNLASQLLGFIPFGYSSPLHEAQPQFSDNYDFSYEHHFKGTDVAMKLTPYYRYGTDQLYETPNLPSLGVSPSFNAGTLRVDGVELLLTKGDFSRNGFSGTFSYTYTNAAEKWSNYLNSTVGPVDQYNQDIQEFNALTEAGGGAKCYVSNSTTYLPDPSCAGMRGYYPPILNPYFAMMPQPTLDPHGWYAPGLDFPYIAPNTFAFVLNYRRGKFAVTP